MSVLRGWGRNDMSPRYRLFRWVLRTLGAIFLGFEVHGTQRVPEKGPLIVAANHRRFFDPVFVSMAVPRRVRWMAKKELFNFPLGGRLFYFLGTFPVDRQGGGRAALRTALGFLAEGRTLGIFPEGTRRKEGVSVEAKSGAALLAARSGAPVLPVLADKVPTPAARLRGEKFRVYIGEPTTVDNTTKGGKGYRLLADEILRTIYALPEKRA
ncbi:MAG TPA: lysophospholipid acyltransferase family protein [Rubrobacteraceae bacterium]|nr:lysophospholipid acyltransferase family protein [Rubrobacteraceae bacterium]